MTAEQFINWLISKYYEARDGNLYFSDGSVISSELMEKILDAIQELRQPKQEYEYEN